MKQKNAVTKLPSNLSPLSEKEQMHIKGGLLIVCEEKRSTFIMKTDTSSQSQINPDGTIMRVL
jgi:hypothetical protein